MTREQRAALEAAVLREALAELRARRRERGDRIHEERLWDVSSTWHSLPARNPFGAR